MHEPRIPQRTRRAALALLAALAVVLVVQLTIGLGDILLFGLVGGLLGSLVVIGFDLLHNAQRATERTSGPRDDPGDSATDDDYKR